MLLTKNGGQINDAEAVMRITPDEGEVHIVTTRGSYNSRKVVLATGPWTKDILEKTGNGLLELPLKVKASLL